MGAEAVRRSGTLLHERGQRHRRHLCQARMRGLVQQPDLDGREACRLAQERRQRLLAARFGEARREVGEGHVGAQVDVQQSGALQHDGVAQGCRKRIDGTAFDACSGDQRFAAHGRLRRTSARCALAAGPRSGGGTYPTNRRRKPQLAGRQRRDGDAPLGEQRKPNRRSSRGAASLPRRAPAPLRRRRPPPPCRERRTPAARSSSQPSQRRRVRNSTPAAARRASQARSSGDAFMATGKHAAAGADEGRLAEPFAPGAHGLRRQGFERRTQTLLAPRRSGRESARYPRYG